MNRPLFALILVTALAALGFGCNAILGTDSHTLNLCTPDATKCDDTGAVLVCADGQKWTEQTKCPFACSDGECVGGCVPGDTQCMGNTPQTCDAKGEWQSEAPCTNACVAGACAGMCAPGALQCTGTTPQTCDAMGQWQDGAACPFVCEMGVCSGVCKPNDIQCMGNTTQVCDAKGQWQSSTACPYVCSAGLCTGMCVPGSTQCNGNTPQTCDATGTWQSGTACPKVCSAGACTGMCVPGSTQCSSLTTQTCDSTGNWVNGTTCPFVCQGGACTGVCSPNATQCQGKTPQTCNANGQWQSGAACPFVCNGGACTGMCVPGATQPCGSVATCNSGGMQTCDPTGTWGACMPAASPCAMTPAGWSPVALTNGACPSGFGFPQVYTSGVMAAPYTCTCSCSGTQVCSGTVLVNQYGNTSCTGNPVSSTSIPVSTNCQTIGGGPSIVAGDGERLSNVVFGPSPACSAMSIATNKPTPTQTQMTVCQPNLACTGGACLSAAQQASMCVSHAGSMVCPAGFPTKTTLSLGVSDTRACSNCACGSTLGCTFNSALLDNDNSCSLTTMYKVTATATGCTTAPTPGFPLNATQANATVTGSGTCAQTAPSNPTGGVALDPLTTVTVCCP
jgi:hypothetical protein